MSEKIKLYEELKMTIIKRVHRKPKAQQTL